MYKNYDHKSKIIGLFHNKETCVSMSTSIYIQRYLVAKHSTIFPLKVDRTNSCNKPMLKKTPTHVIRHTGE